VIVVAPSKVSVLSGRKALLGGLLTARERTLTGNCSTIDEPVAVLALALVTPNGAGVDHRNCIVSIEGDGRVDGGQRESRSGRHFCSIIQSQTMENQP
jgi:hypothetical protein